MEKLTKILIIVLSFVILYSMLCIILSALVSLYKLITKKEPFLDNFKENYVSLFLNILDISNYF
jgi:maltodextrin utilization protein YvdJ